MASRTQRRRLYPPPFTIFAILFALALSVSLHGTALAAGAQHAKPATSAENCQPGACSGNYYGANLSAMTTATSRWPQLKPNWCGVSNIQAIEEYDWWRQTGLWNQGDYTQAAIDNDLNSSGAVSPWGEPYIPPKAVKANISSDFGTDPRAIESGAYDVTPAGFYFHNYIYQTIPENATYDFALDFGPYHGVNNPISVTVWHGQRSS